MLKRSIKSHIASDGGMRFFCVYTHIKKTADKHIVCRL